MANIPNWTSTPRIGAGLISSASTNLASPTAVLIFTAAAGGSRIHRIDICAQATTNAGMVHLFWYDGSNYRIWKSIDVDAITLAAGTPPFQVSLLFPEGLPVPGTGFNALYAATHVAEAFVVTAYGGDL